MDKKGGRHERNRCLLIGDLRSHNWQPERAGRVRNEVTINIGLVTSDAVVFGCDSIASVTQYFIDPVRLDWDKDADGNLVKDGSGKFSLKFDYGDWQGIVTNAYGGVTKLFEVHPKPSAMVAVTAGLAKLCDRPMASWGAEFYAQQESRSPQLSTCEEICKEFLAFMRAKYDEHYKDSPLPEGLRDGPEFLVGGFGQADGFPSLFRVKVKENTAKLDFGGPNRRTGVAWNGQADSVERFIRGYDTELRASFSDKVTKSLESHSLKVKEYVTETINKILDKLGQKMPEDVAVDIPELASIAFDWQTYRTSIDYANLPHQEAINFVAFLVLLQDGKAKFSRGVATVGGRTHVGIITKEKGLRLVNEPELTHRYTGFADDQ